MSVLRSILKWSALTAGGIYLLGKFMPSRIVDIGQLTIFRTILPASGVDYAAPILSESAKLGISPFVYYGIGMIESRFGGALKNGTGDFIPRKRWIKRKDGTTVERLAPPGAVVEDREGIEYWVPTTTGWGFGVWQIDWGSHRAFIESGNAHDPWKSTEYVTKNILAPAKKVLEARGLTGLSLQKAIIAAYNTGLGNVLKSLDAGKDPDATTHGGDYAAKVLGQAQSGLNKFSAVV